MQPVTFAYSEVISNGWRLFKENSKVLVAYFGLYTLIQVIVAITPDESILALIVSLFSWVAVAVLSVAWTRAGIKIANGEHVEVRELFWFEWGRLVSFWLAGSAYTLVVMLGYLLLIIPGIIWQLTYMFVPFLVLDKRVPIKEAFSMSKQMTVGLRWKLFFLPIIYSGVMLLGLLALGVGVLLAMPTIMMAQFWVYTRLRDRVGIGGPEQTQPVTAAPQNPTVSPTPQVPQPIQATGKPQT